MGFCAPLCSFSQAATITRTQANASWHLPDPITLQNATAAHDAIITTETAGKTLSTDIDSELTTLKAGEAEFAKAQTLNTIYFTAINNFAKNDVAKYNDDLKNYTASGTKYQETLSAYNTAAQKNNALPANARKQTIVDTLNKHKAQLDAWFIQLGKWEGNLNAAKTKLDVTKQSLQKQKQKYDVANQRVVAKLKASKNKLTALLGQMMVCANYAGKYRQLLTDKFNETNTADSGYFATPVYNNLIANANKELEKLKTLPGIIWEDNK